MTINFINCCGVIARDAKRDDANTNDNEDDSIPHQTNSCTCPLGIPTIQNGGGSNHSCSAPEDGSNKMALRNEYPKTV